MARKYSRGASKKVERVMRERKTGTLKSGRSGRTVKSRKQAIAIGLSEARRGREGADEKNQASKVSITRAKPGALEDGPLKAAERGR
jgi:hypothetical protein